MTECYVPFHSLGGNGIGQEGCSALTAALQQCKQLQVLRWVLNDLLTVILAPQLITYMHIRIVLHIMYVKYRSNWAIAIVECARYPLCVAHSKWRPDISLCRITLIWFIDQESHSEIVFSALKKRIGCFNHKSGCPGCNHAEKRVGYERLILVTETNCTRQPESAAALFIFKTTIPLHDSNHALTREGITCLH